ncbi:hypothetical protein FS749_008246 [Ceratobasidium sp. UAMH 11750]|nr:hypothetical protein FS749_008246 [Ceratobasidium sp. UAMH 11750]
MPTCPSSFLDPDGLSTPFSWGDEPLDDMTYMDPPTKVLTDLDATAPSSIYTSWAAVEAPGWGPITVSSASDGNSAGDVESLVGQVNQGEQICDQPVLEPKGKWERTDQENDAADLQTRDEHNPTNNASPPTASTHTPSSPQAECIKSEPSPVSQGLPEGQIPDWLLGDGEDSYAMLRLSRPATPEPISTPDPLSPNPGLSRPRINQTIWESIPVLKPSLSSQPRVSKVASRPVTQSAGRTGWKIVPSEPSTTPTLSKGIERSGKKCRSKKQAGKLSK